MAETTNKNEVPPLKGLEPVSILTTFRKPNGLSIQDCELLTYQNICKQTLRNTAYRNPSELAEDVTIVKKIEGSDEITMMNQRVNFYLLQTKKTSDLQKKMLKNLSLEELQFDPKEMRDKNSKCFNSFKKREANKQDKECSELLEEFFKNETDANPNLKKQEARDQMLIERYEAKIMAQLGKKYSKEYLQGVILNSELDNKKLKDEIMFTENETDRLKHRFNLQK
ncbi:unnamed protein product [Oikopleura dioica]|uniref:Uncharacterized protein n=1 Tax=Oikopleura dioica TaxID=34765 RepID=E4YS83_OIKDI|nr:unnamed protein product [Oikopleura dioica]